MKIRTCFPAVAVLCLGALASCTSSPSTQKVPMSAALKPDASLQGRLLAEVNSYRQSKGSTSLKRNSGLDRMAQEHAEFLRRNRGKFGLYGKNVSHQGFDGRALRAREQLKMSTIGENVAAAKLSHDAAPSTLVKLWANSKGHDFNLRGGWTDTGIGVVVDGDGTVFAAQLFGTPSLSQMTTVDRFRQF